MVAKRKIVIQIEDIGSIHIERGWDYRLYVYDRGGFMLDPVGNRKQRLEMLEKMMRILSDTIETEINEVKVEMSAAATVEWM